MSERATPDGLKRAKEKRRQFDNDQAIADLAELHRSTVQKFFAGQGVGLPSFKAICTVLELPWQEIAGLKSPPKDQPEPKPTLQPSELEEWVRKARQRAYKDIEKRCGEMRVLDMRQPIGLGAIYTDVNILEKITSKSRCDVDELMQGCSPETFDRFLLGRVREERVDGLDAVQREKHLMILGRPGAGKTTFLKRLATLCNRGEFLPEQIPIFVTLKEFAEVINQPGLLNFIAHYFAPEIERETIDRLLKQGRGLVLLDGLDEVLERDHDRILHEIRELAQRYDASHIVITCRIAAREYVFQQFTDVEVADFNDGQIQDFADKWFKTKEPTQVDAAGKSTLAQLFWDALEDREPIKELAVNPLLLTLLCLEFEQSAEFPRSRVELYERSLNVLLSKWDGQRRIKRDEVYQRLSIKRKESLLGQLAMQTFERGDYFFKTHVAERTIGQYIQNLPDASTDPEALLVDSRAVLKSIEAQHGLLTERATGIYSFSHLTFHEYFTARNILEAADPQTQQAAIQNLVSHIIEKRWREVFFLVSERMEPADYIVQLMKQQIDQTLANEATLQRFLEWLMQKSQSVNTPYKSAAVRAFYFITIKFSAASEPFPNLKYYLERSEALTSSLASAVQVNLGLSQKPKNYLDLILDSRLALDQALDRKSALNFDKVVYQTIQHNFDELQEEDLSFLKTAITALIELSEEDLNFQSILKNLQEELLSLEAEKNSGQYFLIKVTGITQKLKNLLVQHRNIGHDWQFSDEQKELLQKYYEANLLLVQCLNSECYVSREVRREIEETLLLPIAEIEARQLG